MHRFRVYVIRVRESKRKLANHYGYFHVVNLSQGRKRYACEMRTSDQHFPAKCYEIIERNGILVHDLPVASVDRSWVCQIVEKALNKAEVA